MEIGSLRNIGLGIRLARSLVAYEHYLLKMVWPAGLALPYLRPAQLPVWEILRAVALVGVLSGAALWQGRRRPYLLVGWLWFLCTLLPVIGLVPVGSSAVADRYTYFPLVGLFIAVVWAAADLAQARGNRSAALAVSMPLKVLFPLTLTLSPEEREFAKPVCEHSPDGGPFPVRPNWLPLLGERVGVRGNGSSQLHGYG